MGVSLVGLPGSGKSTVGRQLSRHLGWRFVDTDAVIEQRLGEPIRSFFERAGESAFRDLESLVIAELATSEQRMVMATGGGAVLRPENREHLHQSSHVVYLRSSPEELVKRLRHDTQRPLLQVKDPLARLRELFAQRDPLYREIAHFTIETGRPSVATLINTVLMQLELAGVVKTAETPPDGASAESAG